MAVFLGTGDTYRLALEYVDQAVESADDSLGSTVAEVLVALIETCIVGFVAELDKEFDVDVLELAEEVKFAASAVVNVHDMAVEHVTDNFPAGLVAAHPY